MYVLRYRFQSLLACGPVRAQVRQLLAILLSCALFGHPLGSAAIAGLVLVFAATFIRAFKTRLVELLARLRRPAFTALPV